MLVLLAIATSQPALAGWRDWLIHNITTAAAILTAMATIVGVAYGAYRKGFIPIRNFVRRVNLVLNDHTKIVASVTRIEGEVTHNGGGSLKDAVKRIERSTQTIAAIQNAQIQAEESPCFYTDANGEVTSVTAGYSRLTGLDLHAAQREGWKRAIHPDDLDEVLSRWHEAIRTGTVFVAEYRYINIVFKNRVACRVTANPIMVNNKLEGFAGRVEKIAETEPEVDPTMKAAFESVLKKE